MGRASPPQNFGCTCIIISNSRTNLETGLHKPFLALRWTKAQLFLGMSGHTHETKDDSF